MSIIEVSRLSKQYRIGASAPHKTLRDTIMNAAKTEEKSFNDCYAIIKKLITGDLSNDSIRKNRNQPQSL